jgi:hypothetical protein
LVPAFDSLMPSTRLQARVVERIGPELGLTSPAPQLVEGSVAGDAEEPCPCAAPAGIEPRLLAVGALERRCGDVLGGAEIAQQASGIGIDVIAAGAVEPLEVEPALGRHLSSGKDCVAHALTTGEAAVRHRIG